MNANGTEGRVYGGDPELLHIPDGRRGEFGQEIADFITKRMREINGGRTDPLCPGCCNVVVFNIALALAKANGQSITELGFSMAKAFIAIAQGTKESFEEIEIILDPC